MTYGSLGRFWEGLTGFILGFFSFQIRMALLVSVLG